MAKLLKKEDAIYGLFWNYNFDSEDLYTDASVKFYYLFQRRCLEIVYKNGGKNIGLNDYSYDVLVFPTDTQANAAMKEINNLCKELNNLTEKNPAGGEDWPYRFCCVFSPLTDTEIFLNEKEMWIYLSDRSLMKENHYLESLNKNKAP